MKRPLRLLQVEDFESDAELIVRLLDKAGYDVASRRVEDAEAMRAALAEQVWDVIIADYRLPQFDAPAALAVLHESGLDIPFIVVSGAIGEDVAVRIMRSGAHDYLMKNNLARLGPAVEKEISDAQMRRERQQAEEALRESERRLAQAVQATKLGAFDFYPQTGKLIASEFLKHHFGLSPDAECSYRGLQAAVHPEDRPRVGQTVLETMRPESGGECAAEYRVIGIEDGIQRWLAIQGRVSFDRRGRPIRFVGVTRDITENKRIERELHDTVRELQSALTEKTVLLKEVHHRVKNNLAVISSVLGMKAEVTANAEAKLALEESQRRVQSIALIHEHLYGNDRLNRINFSEYAQQLVHELYQIFVPEPARISLSVEADPLELGIHRAIPCGLILNELVSNAFKYAFRDGRSGLVGVSCREIGPNLVKLEVFDNGAGISEDLDWQHTNSLGLQIVQILARQIDATIQLVRESGTRFVLTVSPDERQSTS